MRSALAAAVAVPMVVAATALPAHAAGPVVHAASTPAMAKIASRGYTCSGRLLQKKNLVVNKKVVGVLRVYTTNANHVLVKACYSPNGPAFAKVNHIEAVEVLGYASRTAKKPSVTSYFRANSHKIIGPAGVKNMGVIGRCAVAVGGVKIGAKKYTVTSDLFCYTRIYK